MAESRPKDSAILETALNLLSERGDHGLSMRKVAEGAGISLGHLQHYFPNKPALLNGLVSEHFGSCFEALEAHVASESSDDPARRVQRLVEFGFDYVGDGYSETARVFREFWALSSRHPEVREHLDAYYQRYVAALVAFLRPVAASKASARRAVLLLLPWFEGYVVTSGGMGADRKAAASLIARSVAGVLADGSRR